jgi:hypothetical protein
MVMMSEVHGLSNLCVSSPALSVGERPFDGIDRLSVQR